MAAIKHESYLAASRQRGHSMQDVQQWHQRVATRRAATCSVNNAGLLIINGDEERFAKFVILGTGWLLCAITAKIKEEIIPSLRVCDKPIQAIEDILSGR